MIRNLTTKRDMAADGKTRVCMVALKGQNTLRRQIRVLSSVVSHETQRVMKYVYKYVRKYVINSNQRHCWWMRGGRAWTSFRVSGSPDGTREGSTAPLWLRSQMDLFFNVRRHLLNPRVRFISVQTHVSDSTELASGLVRACPVLARKWAGVLGLVLQFSELSDGDQLMSVTARWKIIARYIPEF